MPSLSSLLDHAVLSSIFHSQVALGSFSPFYLATHRTRQQLVQSLNFIHKVVNIAVVLLSARLGDNCSVSHVSSPRPVPSEASMAEKIAST